MKVKRKEQDQVEITYRGARKGDTPTIVVLAIRFAMITTVAEPVHMHRMLVDDAMVAPETTSDHRSISRFFFNAGEEPPSFFWPAEPSSCETCCVITTSFSLKCPLSKRCYCGLLGDKWSTRVRIGGAVICWVGQGG